MSAARSALGAGRVSSTFPSVSWAERCAWKRAEVAEAMAAFLAHPTDRALLLAVNSRRTELRTMQVAHARRMEVQS